MAQQQQQASPATGPSVGQQQAVQAPPPPAAPPQWPQQMPTLLPPYPMGQMGQAQQMLQTQGQMSEMQPALWQQAASGYVVPWGADGANALQAAFAVQQQQQLQQRQLQFQQHLQQQLQMQQMQNAQQPRPQNFSQQLPQHPVGQQMSPQQLQQIQQMQQQQNLQMQQHWQQLQFQRLQQLNPLQQQPGRPPQPQASGTNGAAQASGAHGAWAEELKKQQQDVGASASQEWSSASEFLRKVVDRSAAAATLPAPVAPPSAAPQLPRQQQQQPQPPRTKKDGRRGDAGGNTDRGTSDTFKVDKWPDSAEATAPKTASTADEERRSNRRRPERRERWADAHPDGTASGGEVWASTTAASWEKRVSMQGASASGTRSSPAARTVRRRGKVSEYGVPAAQAEDNPEVELEEGAEAPRRTRVRGKFTSKEEADAAAFGRVGYASRGHEDAAEVAEAAPSGGRRAGRRKGRTDGEQDFFEMNRDVVSSGNNAGTARAGAGRRRR